MGTVVIYHWQRSKAKNRKLYTLLFSAVKIRDISLSRTSRTELFGTWDTASKFRTVRDGQQSYFWPLYSEINMGFRHSQWPICSIVICLVILC